MNNITNKKTFSVEIIISEYHSNDEGFYHIKKSYELSNGKKELIESFNEIVSNVRKYIKKKITNEKIKEEEIL